MGQGKFSGKKCRLVSMFCLTTAFFLVEIIVGYLTNSMALVADSFHMLSDIAALVIAFISVRMAPKSWSKNTFGWARAEVLRARANPRPKIDPMGGHHGPGGQPSWPLPF